MEENVILHFVYIVFCHRFMIKSLGALTDVVDK